MTALQVRRWSDAEFAAGREAWQGLLARSDANPLFMSFDWIERWWRHHATALSGRLHVLGVYSPDGVLRALVPLYSRRGTYRGVIRTRRIELLGCAWRDASAVFTEYLDLVAERGSEDAVCLAVRDHLLSEPWDELLLCNLREGSIAERLARQLRSVYLRPPERMTGWTIALPASFDSYVAALGSNVRRKVLHQRDKMPVSLHVIEDPVNRRAAYARLEQWAARRWGGAPARSRADFHAELVERADAGVRLTELRAGAGCISIMLNLRVADTEYYLQSGFDPAQARGVSPGYLHLGHAIEAACRDGIRHFDFLAGPGLHREYKRDFAAAPSNLQTLQIVRRRSLRVLFGLLDRLRGRG